MYCFLLFHGERLPYTYFYFVSFHKTKIQHSAGISTSLPQNHKEKKMTAQTAPAVQQAQEGEEKFNLARWLIGYLAFWIIMSIGFAMVSQVLLPQRIKDLGAANPTAVLGAMTSVGSIIALVANIVVGALSDMTRTRFGRRTPWLFWGAWFTLTFYLLMGNLGIIVGVTAALWLSKLGFNMMNSPIYSTVSDRVPEKYRGTISSAIGFGNTLGLAIGAWVGAKFATTTQSVHTGFMLASFFMFISAILFLIIIPREPSNKDEAVRSDGRNVWQHLVYSFTPPLHAPDFWRAFGCRSLLLLAIQMLAAYWLYICQDYMGLSKVNAAAVVGNIALFQMVASIVAMIVGPLSDRIRRRKPMVVLAAVLAIIGFIAPMVSHTVTAMYVELLYLFH